ncbi:MAG: hypothetical protein JWN48_5572 [Myxococcaceae bacterium]|nr:hypothetical protein [Myxococcaceae bacterium]
MMTPRLSRRKLVASSFAVAAIIIWSCNLHNPGVSPPPAALSFPSALALSKEPDAPPRLLYVANSNFDLRYNAGSLQSYRLSARVGADGVRRPGLDEVIDANRCRTFGNASLVRDDAGLPVRDDAGVLVHIDAGQRVLADNTRYPTSTLLDAGVPDASLDDAAASDGGVPGPAPLGDGLDASVVVLPGDYAVTSNYGNARGFLCDGRDPGEKEGAGDCCFDTQAELDAIRQSAFEIDSFAVGVAVAPDNGRVYVPVSSNNRLVYFDVVDDELRCGTETTRCRRGPGRKSPDNVPDDEFPGQLSEIVIGQLKDLLPPSPTIDPFGEQVYMATTHENGAVGLFVVPSPDASPVLDATVRGLGQRPRSITADPRTQLLYVTSFNQSFISRVGLRVGTPKDAPVPSLSTLLYETSRITVSGVSQPNDLRDLAVDPVNPNRLYALIRGTQESVVFLDVDTTLSNTNARVIDEVRVGAGPSKMIRIQQDGKTFLVVTCYDSKAVYVIDTETHLLAAVVRSFSGPFSMVYDEPRKLLHVADFRSSIMRVVDLEGLTDKSAPPPRIIATIGSPQFEGALQ